MNSGKKDLVSAEQGLFSPFPIGQALLKNRVIALPIFTGYAHPDGRVSRLMIEHYARLADSGAAMAVVANAAVSADGVTSTFNLRADQDDFIPGLAGLARAIKKRGALACLQLNHAGRFARADQPLLPAPLDGANFTFNVSSLRDFMTFFPLEKRFPLTRHFLKKIGSWRRAMTGRERQRIIDDFAKAAQRAIEAGFDMVELHGASGYLLNQFLSPFTNRMQDGTKKDLQTRMIFPLAVVREVIKCLPRRVPVGFRLMVREWVPGGVELPEALTFARHLEDEGIAYLSPSAASFNSMFAKSVMKHMAHPAYLRKEVTTLTLESKIPVVLSGRIIKPALADRMIREGVAELIGLGRPLRSDFDWIHKARKKDRRVVACIDCHTCLKRVVLEQGFGCSLWPRALLEKVDVEHKLLTRMYKGLWVIKDLQDIPLLQDAFPLLLPEKDRISAKISPTVLFIRRGTEEGISTRHKDDFLRWGKDLLDRFGFEDNRLKAVIRTAREDLDKEVQKEVDQGNHGVILLAGNRQERWRERVPYRARGKVVALIGSDSHPARVLVPVDLSPTTLLVLMFISRALLDKPGFEFTFLHVQRGPTAPLQKRWEEIKKTIGSTGNFRLRIIPSAGKVVEDILQYAEAGEFGTIVMGKRGLSGIKRRLLGSVASGVMRGLKNQSLFLID